MGRGAVGIAVAVCNWSIQGVALYGTKPLLDAVSHTARDVMLLEVRPNTRIGVQYGSCPVFDFFLKSANKIDKTK